MSGQGPSQEQLKQELLGLKRGKVQTLGQNSQHQMLMQEVRSYPNLTAALRWQKMQYQPGRQSWQLGGREVTGAARLSSAHPNSYRFPPGGPAPKSGAGGLSHSPHSLHSQRHPVSSLDSSSPQPPAHLRGYRSGQSSPTPGSGRTSPKGGPGGGPGASK
jgi:hypothetical protein